MGEASFHSPWVSDKLKAECEPGITTNNSMWKFETSIMFLSWMLQDTGTSSKTQF